MTSQDVWRKGCLVVGGFAAFSLADVAVLTAQEGEPASYRRDPFLPPFSTPISITTPEVRVDTLPKTPLQRAKIEDFKLVGVIWAIDEPRALVEGRDGLGYIVMRGTLIGSHGGAVKVIESQRIVIEEPAIDPFGKQIMKEKELRLTGAGWSQDDKQ